MLLRKDSGGSTVNWRGASYDWPEDGSVCDVPVEMAMELLAIHGGGYSEVPAEEEAPANGGNGSGGGDEEAPPKPAAKPRSRATAKTS